MASIIWLHHLTWQYQELHCFFSFDSLSMVDIEMWVASKNPSLSFSITNTCLISCAKSFISSFNSFSLNILIYLRHIPPEYNSAVQYANISQGWIKS
mmetsp:Transcript_8608/g.11536  ORF Transcript_8608/g.11536 Transcript_8608/m.11536 type:complete len:97 (+) Transcript_8608:242-532(+)